MLNPSELEPIDLQDGQLQWCPAFIDVNQAEIFFAQLRDEVPWEQHFVKIIGKQIPAPRLSCWMGDKDASYRYSGNTFAPHPWTQAVQALRDSVAKILHANFNSVLLNRYRNGQDAMGWHSDNEKELGENPLIASVSLGATREFRLRHKHTKQLLKIELPPGSLLVMQGATQRFWQHALPRTAKPCGERINLTFRRIGLVQNATVRHRSLTANQ